MWQYSLGVHLYCLLFTFAFITLELRHPTELRSYTHLQTIELLKIGVEMTLPNNVLSCTDHVIIFL